MWDFLENLLLLMGLIAWLTLWLMRELGRLGVRRGATRLPRPPERTAREDVPDEPDPATPPPRPHRRPRVTEIPHQRRPGASASRRRHTHS